METSFRYGGDSKSLKVYTKEKYPFSSNALLQVNAELDTRIGAPTSIDGMIRCFYPELSASAGVGVQYKRNQRLSYSARAKKSFQVTNDGFVSFNVKGRCTVDEELRRVKYNGGSELVWNIFNIKKDQDLRLKLGYDLVDKMPYFQIRENNWTFNTDGNRRWNVRYDL